MKMSLSLYQHIGCRKSLPRVFCSLVALLFLVPKLLFFAKCFRDGFLPIKN